MKILLIGINSRYVHPNLALGYLKEIAKQYGLSPDLKEYTVNMQPRDILLDSGFENYDGIAFSAYIWNGDYVKKLAWEMRLIHPGAIYLCGGPEVLGGLDDYLDIFDGVIMGEGESPFRSFLESPYDRTGWKNISYKGNLTEINREMVLDFSYPHDEARDKTIVYYEAQRGCPFACSYCMSGSTGVRYRPMELVKDDLLKLIENEIPLVKFVDRSFNVHLDKAMEILDFIKKNDRGKTSFHMELAPNLLTEEFREFFRDLRPGLFQVEIGVQSTQDIVNKKVYRNLLYSSYRDDLKKFIEVFPGHVHLDLISGLPGSSFENIRSSYIELESLGGDYIQLGFLKLLPGTRLYNEKDQHAIEASSFAPYEVLETKDISFAELKLLKTIEKMMDLYPREDLPLTMEYLTRERSSFDVYWRLAEKFPRDKVYSKMSLESRFEILGNISGEVIRETLELDYARKRRNQRFIFFPGRKRPGGQYIESYYDGSRLSDKKTLYRIDYEEGLLAKEKDDV